MLLGSALCVRLGIWQLDRLEQRRTFNAHVQAMWAAESLNLPEDAGQELEEMEYRSVCVAGEYDLENQVVIRNQYWQDQYGYHLLTPVVFSEGLAVMVDRGWIPAEDNELPSAWRQYDEVAEVEICGIIRLGRAKPDVGGRPDPTLAPDVSGLALWNNVNLSRMAEQIPYDLLPVYVQLDVVDGDDLPPVPFPARDRNQSGAASRICRAVVYVCLNPVFWVSFLYQMEREDRMTKKFFQTLQYGAGGLQCVGDPVGSGCSCNWFGGWMRQPLAAM